jgi:hypothetical protein
MFDDDHTFARDQACKSDHTISSGQNLVALFPDQINPTMAW